MDAEGPDPIVLDIGSHLTRAGLSLQDSPKVQFPTVVGRPFLASAVSLENKDLYIGREAVEKQDILNLTYPMSGCLVRDWEELEQVYNHIFFNELAVDPSQHRLMLILPPTAPRVLKEQYVDLMFNEFAVSSLYIANSSVLSLFATGKTTGVVVESGLRQTYVSPIFEGYQLPHATLQLDLGGNDVTSYLAMIIREGRQDLPPTKELEIAQDIKVKLCYLALDFQQELNTTTTSLDTHKEYKLPDESVITLSVERFKSAEIMFQPLLCGKDSPGVHELTYNSIMKCDPDIRTELFSNMVLSGGNTMLRNTKEKLRRDVKALAPSNVEITVKAPPERRHLPWIGGAIFSSIATFAYWTSKQEFEANGASVIHRKCF